VGRRSQHHQSSSGFRFPPHRSLRVGMDQRPTHRNESRDVTPAKAGVHVRQELHSRFRRNDVTPDRSKQSRSDSLFHLLLAVWRDHCTIIGEFPRRGQGFCIRRPFLSIASGIWNLEFGIWGLACGSAAVCLALAWRTPIPSVASGIWNLESGVWPAAQPRCVEAREARTTRKISSSWLRAALFPVPYSLLPIPYSPSATNDAPSSARNSKSSPPSHID
jgi:hypothetical protein